MTIFGEQGINGSYTMMANTIRALELHYTMIQFLIIIIMLDGYGVSFTFCATGAISNPYCKKTGNRKLSKTVSSREMMSF